MSERLTLDNGLYLGYAIYGDPNGKPIIHNHGSSGSRFERLFQHGLLEGLDIKLIVPDRPGHGLSSHQPKRSLADWAKTIGQLADKLGLPSFRVVGYSAGDPHAAAIARFLSDRVEHLSLVSSLAPYDRRRAFNGVGLAGRMAVLSSRYAHPLLRLVAPLQVKAIRQNPEQVSNQLSRTLPPQNLELFQQDAAKQVLIETLSATYERGGAGAVDDIRVWTRPWGFALKDLKVSVHVWQGTQDKTAVPAMGAYLAQSITNAELFELEDEGHLALYRHWEDILRAAIT